MNKAVPVHPPAQFCHAHLALSASCATSLVLLLLWCILLLPAMPAAAGPNDAPSREATTAAAAMAATCIFILQVRLA